MNINPSTKQNYKPAPADPRLLIPDFSTDQRIWIGLRDVLEKKHCFSWSDSGSKQVGCVQNFRTILLWKQLHTSVLFTEHLCHLRNFRKEMFAISITSLSVSCLWLCFLPFMSLFYIFSSSFHFLAFGSYPSLPHIGFIHISYTMLKEICSN